ncbi:MAG TPA: glutamate--tRNA ligase [Acidobacteriota bacterium]|nr:glutamate--tRNA ligase [Acidobacteriota bacterium]
MKQVAPVRVRFAPSPTGYLHVGNVRTALFNWFVARHSQGSFILRIEDTDAERSRPEYEGQLLEDLRWLNLDWDESVDIDGGFGPYRQSDRYRIYQQYAQRLLDEDKAFRCFCSEVELEEVRQQQLARGEMPRYSGKCRGLSPADVAARMKSGLSPTQRLRVRQGTVGFLDLVFGRIDIDTNQISDPVLLRSDGSPTYNFSCVVDDILMRITHVIRGDGHISNTHRQILIYEAFGASVPQFAHLPTVLGPDGQKLSKRHGATSVEEFRVQGYLPEALVNYLALLGWSPPEEGKEILAIKEIVSRFDLSRVSRSPAIFDPAKLNWMNRSYLNQKAGDSLVKLAEPYFVSAGLIHPHPGPEVQAWLARVIDAVKTHVDTLSQLPQEVDIIYGFESDPPELDADAQSALQAPEARAVAQEFLRLVEMREPVTPESYREIVGQVKEATRQKGKALFHPIRAALTGRGSGPELERLVPLYEDGSRLDLPRKVMSCRERLRAVLPVIR